MYILFVNLIFSYFSKIDSLYIVKFCGFSNFLLRFKFAFNGNYLLNWPIIEVKQIKLVYFVFDNTLSIFPINQQTKYARLKSKVYNTCLNTIKFNFLHLIIWHSIFYFSGQQRILVFYFLILTCLISFFFQEIYL